MATTEIEIPVSVSIKKDEREDNAFSSGFLEGKVTEHLENNIKQLESEPNQPVESSSHLAETVNTQLESDKRTDEGGIFFQALSVPVVIADEQHINTPKSCETTTMEDQDDKRTAKIETFKEEKPNDDDDERVAVVASKETEDHNVVEVEAISAQTEGKEPEIVKTIENVEKDNEEIRPSVETQTKVENGITEDEKKDDGGQMKSEETGSKKAESEGLEVLDSMAPSKKEIASSQDETSEDIKETTTSQHATTVAYFKEQNLNETDDKSVDGQEASEQSEEKPVESVEQEERTEVIKPLIETDEKIEQKGLLDAITTDTCIPTQTKSQIETTEHERNDEEDATESDDGQKVSSVKEVCEETASEKVESEKEIKLSDSSSMKLEEKAIPTLNKDDDQENKQEVNVSEKSQEKNHYSESSEPELAETKEVIEKDTQETEYNVKTLEKTAVPTDVCISTETESEEKTPKNEEKNDKEVESEEVFNLSDNSRIVSNENVILSEEDQDKLHVSEKGLSGGDDVTSSQNASSEYIKETTSGQHATTPAYLEEGKDLHVMPTDIIKEDGDDRIIDPQKETEQCKNEAKDKREQKEEIEQEDETKEIKPSDEKLHVITVDTSNSTQAESHVESEEHEEKNEEDVIESDDGQKENSEIPLVKEAHKDNTSEKAEYEEVKHSDTSKIPLVEEACIDTTSEKAEHEEVKHSDTSEILLVNEECKDTTSEKAEHEEVKHSDTSEIPLVEEARKDTTSEKAEYEEVEHSDTSEIPLVEEACKDATSEKAEYEEVKHSDTSEIPLVEEACKDTTSEKAEYEEVKHSDTSEIPLVEKECKDTTSEKTENEEVKHSDTSEIPLVEEACKDTTSEKAEYEEVKHSDTSEIPLVEKECKDTTSEKTENEEVKHSDTSEIPLVEEACKDTTSEKAEYEEVKHSDTSEIPLVEEACKDTTSEKAEYEEVRHLDTTEIPLVEQACKDTTLEKAEYEEVKHSDTSEIPLVEEACKDTTSEKAEYEEVKHSDTSEIPLVEEACKDTTSEKAEYEEVKHSDTSEIPLVEKECKDTTSEKTENEEVKHSDTSEIPLVEEACKDTTSEKAEYEEVKHSDTSEIPLVEEACKDTTSEKAEYEEVRHLDTTEIPLVEQACKDTTLEKAEYEEVKHSDTSEIPLVEEACKDTTSEKAEYEEVKHSDTSEIPLVEEACKDTTSEKAEYEEVKHSDTTEIPLVEEACKDTTSEKAEYEEVKHSDTTEIPLVEEACKDTTSEKAEYEEVKHSDTSEIPLVQEACEDTTSEKAEYEEVKHSDTSEIPLVQEACEDTTSEKAEYEEVKHSDTSEIPLVQEACEDTTSEKAEYEEVKHSDTSEIPLVQEACEDTTSEKVEYEEVKRSDTSEIPLVKEACKDTTSEKADYEEIKHSNTSEVPLVKEACKDITSEKADYEEVKHSDTSDVKLDEREITVLREDEDQESEQNLKMLEKTQVEDEVTSLHDEMFEGGLQEKNHHSEGNEHEVATTKESTEEDTEETITTKKETTEENEEIRPSVETQTKPEDGITEDAKKDDDMKSEETTEKAECKGLKVLDSMEPSNKEIASEDEDRETEEKDKGNGDEVTSSKDATSDDIKETTTSQHATTVTYFKEQDLNETDDKSVDAQEASEQSEDQESEQKLKMSGKNQVEDEVTSLHNEMFEGGLQEKNHHSEGNEHDVATTKESTEEDTEEIITTKEETTEENEEKNDEKSKSPLVEVCKEAVPEKTNEHEEVLIHSDSSSMVLNENEIVRKDEYKEKEQEFYVSEKGQSGGDDVTSSQNVSSEDIKEMVSQHATEVAYFEEVQGLNAMAKDVVKEDEKDRTTVPQEASEQYENGVHDKREQKPEEIIHSCLEIEQEEYAKEIKPSVETEVKEEQEISTQTETQVESQLEATEHEEKNKEEVIESDDGTECKTAGGTQNISPENKDDTIANESKSIEGIMQHDLYATHEQKSIDALEQEKSISGELQARVENEPQEDLRGHQLVDSKSENPCTTEQDTLEEVEEKTTMKPEEITKEAFQENQSETNKEIEAKLETERSEVKDEVVLTEKVSELGQPMEQNVEEIQACQTTTMSEKVQDEIPEKAEDLSLGSIEDTNGKIIKEEKSFLDERTRELEISTLEHEPVGDKTTINPEEITKQAFHESQSETKEIEAKLDVENQVGEREDKSEVKDEVVLTEKVSSELGQPMEQNVEEIQVCHTTTMTEKVEDEIPEKVEDLSLGSIDDTNGNTIKEEKSFLDEKTRELEISTLEHELVGDKTTINPKEIGIQGFDEIQSETNKEIEAKLDAENQVVGKEDRSEVKDEVVLTEKVSSELGQPIEQNVEEIQACQTTTMSEKVQDEIPEKVEDLSLGSIEDTNDNTIKEEKSFLDERTRELEISTLEHEPVGEKTTINPEEITIQAIHESQSETNKEIEAKLDVENQTDESEDKSETKDEVVVTQKVSSELGQPMEQNVEEIQACHTTTMSEQIEDENAEKVEDLSLGSINDTNGETIKEEKSFSDERTKEIEISTLEHEPVGEKTTIKPEEITKEAFQENQSETNKEIEAKLETERSEVKDEVVLTEKVSELGQPMEQNVEEIQACQTTTMSEKVQDEIPEKAEDLSLGSIEDTNGKIIKEEKSFLDEITRELEISTLEHEPVREKTTINPEEITIQGFDEIQSETNKEIEAKLDAENQVVGKEDRSEVKDEVVLTEKVSSELGQPMEQNVDEIQACQTTTMSEKVEDELPKKVEDLSIGSVDDTDDKTIKEEKSFLDERTREFEISTLEHEFVGDKTTINPKEITIQGFDETKSETNKEIEAKLDAENQVDGREDKSEMKDEVLLTEKMSSELEQPMEQNTEEIQPCQTTTISEKIEDEIAEKVEDLSLGNIEDTNDNTTTTTEEKSFSDGRTREVEISTLEHEPVEEKNSGVDEVSKKKYTDLNEATTTEDTLHSEKSKAESENLPIALDSVSEVENRIMVPKSEDLNLKEECLISATPISVDDERETVTKEISSDEISHSDPIAVEIPEVVADSEESIVKEERVFLATTEHTNEKNGKEEQEIKTNDISSEEKKEQTTESKQVVEHTSMICPDAVLIEENLEIYEELKPTSELTIDEDQVDETKPQPEQSDITSENNQTLESKLEHTSEKDLNRTRDMEEDVTLASENQINSPEDQNETVKNVILKENVVVEIEKEEGKTEVKGQDSEEDNCPKELEKTSTSNLKESANEIEYSQSIPIENTEVAEVKASSTIGDVKEDSVDEASRSESVPILEDSKALELQVNLPELESIDTPLNDQDGMKLSEEIETTEQKDVLVSQLKDKEILEEEEKEEATDKEEKNDGLISEIQTPEEILKMEVKEELLEATTDSCETLKDGLSSEKLLDERKEIDAKEDTEITVSGEEKAAEDSYQDAAAEVTAISQTEEAREVIEKLVSMVPPEELASSTTEDQTNELVTETDKTKVEHSSISNKDRNLEEFTKTLSDNQSVEKYIKEEGEGNFGVENKEAKSGNEIVEDVIVNEVLLEVEKVEESKSIKDNINEEASSIPNQLTSATDEVCQIKSNSSPNDLLEAKDSVEDIGDLKLTAENLNLKTEESTVTKGPTEDLKQDVEMVEEDANKEKETLDELQSNEPAKTTSDSISHGDMHKLEEEPTKVDEIVAEGKEVSAVLTENLPEASPEMIPVKHDPETITTIDKIEEEIKDKDETLVNMDFPTSTKEVPCLSNEKTEELQVSTLNTEIDEGKQDGGAGDMLNKEREAVQPHEYISDIKSVDPPLDVEIREQEELMPSKDNALLSQNEEKIADLLIQPLVQKEIIQDVDERLEEAPKIDDQKHESDLDYTAKSRSVDVVRDAESPKIEQEHLDTKEAIVEPINQENQSEPKKEADENIKSDIPIEKVPKQITAHKEIADEFLVMPVAKEEEESDKVKKAEPIDIQEETMAEGNLHEEETEKPTNITEETVTLHHGEKGDETNCKATNTEAEIPTEYVTSSDVELKGDTDLPVPNCASTRNPEVRSAILEVLSGMDATADITAEAHVAGKGVLKEDVQLATEKVSGTNQEPFNLPLTKERSMELDAPVTPGTEATENVEISKEYVTDDLTKISQIQPELQQQLPEKPYQNESMESKLLSGNIDASHEQGEPTAKSLNASETEPQCSSEVVKEEKKISAEKEKSETPEPATTDILHESTQGNSKVAENLIEEREQTLTKDRKVEKEETGDNGAKTDGEDEAEEDDEDNQKTGSGSDAPVMVEASKDMEVKVHKKSHNILSGVGSKVKHSIAKVKKAITGKSSHAKPPSPKAAE